MESKEKNGSGVTLGDLLVQFRNKVQEAELLSAATEKLIHGLGFTGKLTICVQNGRVVKSGYEESYFRRKEQKRSSVDQSSDRLIFDDSE